MNPLAILLFLQETLPPPPSPTSNPDIDTAQVIGVVIISLGLIMMAALAVRPLVARKINPSSADEAEAAATNEGDPEPASTIAEPMARSIIQFPKSVAVPTAAANEPWAWPDVEPAIEDRFRRVIADSGRRRKLGDRQPNVPETISASRFKTFVPDLATANVSRAGAPLILPPIVPLRERRTVASATPLSEPLPMVNQESMPVPGTAVSVLERPDQSTEEFQIERGYAQAVIEGNCEDAPIAGVVAGLTDRAIEDETDDVVTAGSLDQDWQGIVEEIMSTESEAEPTIIPSNGFVPALEVDPDDIGLSDVDSGGNAPIEADVLLVEGVDVADDEHYLDDRTLAGISQTVRDLIYCANAGKLLNGFALYSDPYLFRFMDSTGMDETGFRDRFASMPPRPALEWERLDRLTGIVREADGRISATVSYIDTFGKPTNGAERFRFEYSVENSFWMIDDIQSLE